MRLSIISGGHSFNPLTTLFSPKRAKASTYDSSAGQIYQESAYAVLFISVMAQHDTITLIDPFVPDSGNPNLRGQKSVFKISNDSYDKIRSMLNGLGGIIKQSDGEKV